VLDPADPDCRLFYKNQIETCGKCHPQVAKQFATSKHYKALQEDRFAPSCTTCHGAMNKRPDYVEVVRVTCDQCHNGGIVGKRVPQVSERADEILHRLNISKAYLAWKEFYYKSNNWPEGTKSKIDSMRKAYHDILANGHSFNLLQTNDESIDLLTRLTNRFKHVWEEKFGEEFSEH